MYNIGKNIVQIGLSGSHSFQASTRGLVTFPHDEGCTVYYCVNSSSPLLWTFELITGFAITHNDVINILIYIDLPLKT
jgi:hypothetical protein